MRLVGSGEILDQEYRFRRASDGRYRWHLGRALPLRDAGGKITRWFGTCTDIEDQKRVQQSLAFLAEASKLLSESLDYEATLERVARLAVPQVADWCIVHILEPDGSVRRLAAAHADPGQEELSGELWRCYPPDPNEPLGLMNVLRTGRAELFSEVKEEHLNALARNQEHLRLLRELGFKSAMIAPLLARERTLGAISFLMAESGRRCASEDLAFAEDLARRAAFAIDNARLFREVQQADRAKDEFLAMLGHELRNPLAPMRHAVQVLQLRGPRDPQLVRARDVIDRQIRHMSRLVDDLLDVSRITRGRIELRRTLVDLTTVAELAAESARSVIEARRHDFELSLPHEPVWAEVDVTRVEQVLLNLLSNAAKYTEPGGRVSLSLEVEGGGEGADGTEGRRSPSSPPPSTAVIRVRDSGIGIPPEMLPRIFDLFTQADRSLDRSEGGLGLGLTLVRRLVEMHGGSVGAVSSGADRGSEFIVRLPLAAPPPAAARASRRAPSRGSALQAGNGDRPPRRSRVLVVEDNVDAAETLEELLDAWGHDARVVHDGVQAVAVAPEYRPDVVLLDIGLPGMDGYEVARRLRRGLAAPARGPGSHSAGSDESETRGREPLLVALTGYGQEEDRRRSREAGFDIHLTKPVDPECLRALIAGELGAEPLQS
jgi:signal transduction histidine kinase